MVYILDEIVTKSSLYEEVSRRKSYSVVLSSEGCVNRKSSGFAERFRAKGRFSELMAALPVKLITHPQPGLYGAAAAFAAEHLS